MKKNLVLAVMAMFLLCACAAEQQTRATEPPANIVMVTPDASLSTPTVGYVSVRRLEGMQALLLRSQPDTKSALSGRVAPGEKGKVLGLNATGTWALLKFTDQSGWAPVPVLDMVIAQ
jgi:hypothetical protein